MSQSRVLADDEGVADVERPRWPPRRCGRLATMRHPQAPSGNSVSSASRPIAMMKMATSTSIRVKPGRRFMSIVSVRLSGSQARGPGGLWRTHRDGPGATGDADKSGTDLHRQDQRRPAVTGRLGSESQRYILSAPVPWPMTPPEGPTGFRPPSERYPRQARRRPAGNRSVIRRWVAWDRAGKEIRQRPRRHVLTQGAVDGDGRCIR